VYDWRGNLGMVRAGLLVGRLVAWVDPLTFPTGHRERIGGATLDGRSPGVRFEAAQRWDRGATEEEVFAPATTGNEWPSTSAARTDGLITRTR